MQAHSIEKMIQYFGADVRRINHALKVYAFASCIARKENLNTEKITIVEIAAILHDIGIVEAEKKYNSTAGKYQEMEGPLVARELLSDTGISAEMLERICYLIGNHHSYQNIDDLDLQVLIEADFLVNIFEDGMPENSIRSVRDKYFKTKTGIGMIESMYLQKSGT
ncbi:HD superfamily phosphodiesterase [Methanohalophilus levihalophilus]|uniref:HD domain-containing protein n=1 Tax=Methanohalophilus levihalophilus TaxID=1431282 RepID=UPI001AE36395|nr:HD domain-containing protein [Methanohalophilus levihalophilus]MBP2030410.1 HD superfamily phosphodiesterase [Methanohalophilus levihalophilus]